MFCLSQKSSGPYTVYNMGCLKVRFYLINWIYSKNIEGTLIVVKCFWTQPKIFWTSRWIRQWFRWLFWIWGYQIENRFLNLIAFQNSVKNRENATIINLSQAKTSGKPISWVRCLWFFRALALINWAGHTSHCNTSMPSNYGNIGCQVFKSRI